jgi:hypothetical protein
MSGGGFDGDFIARWSLLTGWVVKWKGARESVYLTAAYLLSHAGLAVPAGGPLSCLSGEVWPEPVETVTWWGWHRDWPAPTSGGLEKCPVCGLELEVDAIFQVRWPGAIPANPPDPGKGLVCMAWHVDLVPSMRKQWTDYRENVGRFYFERDYSGADAVRDLPTPPGPLKK